MHQKERTGKPAAGGRKRGRLTLLQGQMLVCGALLAALALCRLCAPAAFAWLRAGYQQYFEQPDLTGELARFASAAWDLVALPVSAEAAAPAGASDQGYAPGQDFAQPVAGAWLSSAYGWRTHPVAKTRTFHRGVDLACAEGTPVLAAMAGSVEYTRYSSAEGNYVRLRHGDGVETLYCHMQYIFVRAGENVQAGQLIGTAGSTGNATGPHLHFALLHDDIYYDPTGLLDLG